MTTSNEPRKPPTNPAAVPTPERVEGLLSSPEMAKAVENDEFKRFLDHVPIAIVISRGSEDQRIVYCNLAFEALTGQAASDVEGKSWSVLDGFTSEDDATLTLSRAVEGGEDFLGTFQADGSAGKHILAQAYAGVIEDESGTHSYRIAALVDVAGRDRSLRDEFERQIRDKDLLLKELQHRVKNNLQLLTALIRLEARAAQRGDTVNLERLAGRVDTLALLYQALSTDHWGPVVDLGPYLSEIASASVRAHALAGVVLDLKMNYCPVSVNVAMPVGLLVNELLTNTYKYAFAGRDGGTITLGCICEEEQRYRIVFADDGVGLPQGITWPTPGKLGALILQTLRENTQQLEFEVISEPGQGVWATIEFVHKPSWQRAS
jgi:PAS domain S-box-containing protein